MNRAYSSSKHWIVLFPFSGNPVPMPPRSFQNPLVKG